MYSSRYRSAIHVEGFGNSPIASVNYEVAPFRYRKSFWTGRIGLGFLPGMKNPPPGLSGGNGISIPVGATYNVLLNSLQNERTKNVNWVPKKYRFEYFLEGGGGYTLALYPKEVRHFLFTTLALRTQLFFAAARKPRVVFARVSVNPVFYRNRFSLLYRSDTGAIRFYGGFALGASIN